MNKRWINKTEQRLGGGHHNSLGNTVAVTEDVLADDSQKLMDELCECYKSEDDVVRMRVSSALKRIAGLHPESISTEPRPEWVMSRFDWLIDDIGRNLDQPSAKWSIAQMVMQLDVRLTKEQRARAVELLRHNLKAEDDWIVICATAQTLASVVLKHKDSNLKKWLIPHLKKMTKDARKSVAAKAEKLLNQL